MLRVPGKNNYRTNKKAIQIFVTADDEKKINELYATKRDRVKKNAMLTDALMIGIDTLKEI